MLVSGSLALAGGTEVTLDSLKSTTPAAWKAVPGKMPFRLYTFTLPKAEGDDKDAQLVITSFGKGGGGGYKENLVRWQGMFLPPKGKAIEDVTKTEKFKVGAVEVTVVDIEGTFKDKFPPFDPAAKTTLRPEWRRINVIFASEDGPYFMYIIGPQKTVASHKDSFEKWLKGFK